jgi:hypothetical protein
MLTVLEASGPRMHNLPANLPSLIGREGDLDKLRPLLSDDHARLLTLSGPSGSARRGSRSHWQKRPSENVPTVSGSST